MLKRKIELTLNEKKIRNIFKDCKNAKMNIIFLAILTLGHID